MVEWGTETFIPNVRFVSLPVQSLSIANILNGIVDDKGYGKDSILSDGTSRFTFKNARLLVVDDIATNLKVVEGLLSPYKATVDTCLSGMEALELIKQKNYDIVFMDHMMPEMDGMEATAIIREMEEERFKSMIIVALTANAVVGMREMFIKNGFNDFLAKPIDVSKLDDILDRWIPKGKKEKGIIIEKNNQVENNSSKDINQLVPSIPGVDVNRGIIMTGGKIKSYLEVLSIFCKDSEQRLHILKTIPDAAGLPAFVTQIHAIKSASASIGAAEVSSIAAEIEAAGKAGDLALIEKLLPAFAENMEKVMDGIKAWKIAVEKKGLTKPDSENNKQKKAGEHSEINILLQELAAALESQNAEAIDLALEKISQESPDTDAKTKEILEQISDEVLMAEYGKARALLANLHDKKPN